MNVFLNKTYINLSLKYIFLVLYNSIIPNTEVFCIMGLIVLHLDTIKEK